MNSFSITGPKILLPDGFQSNLILFVENGIISNIKKNNPTQDTYSLQFPEHYYLVPGFIDTHVHGAHHHDVMDADIHALEKIAGSLLPEGTTAFLATTMTADNKKIEKVLDTVKNSQKLCKRGATLLGVHLEGPFISSEKVGAQNAKYIKFPDLETVAHWQRLSENSIKLITFAPELPGALDWIPFLKELNIIPALGHSNATYAETLSALNQGVNYVTHLGNAMRGMHQREPGMMGGALISPDVYTEIIADGIHLHPAMLKLITKIKSKDKIILVTDSISAKNIGDGEYELGEQKVHVHEGIATLRDGTLAGSTLTMVNAIRHMQNFTECSFIEVIKMATENPARALNIFDKKGSIEIHKDADLVLLNENHQVVLTICRGNIAWAHPEFKFTALLTSA